MSKPLVKPCECCGGNEAAGLRRCAACYELCTRGYSCRLPSATEGAT